MIKSIQAFFTKNLAWKLFSIITAILLWCVVINITKPIETRSYTADIHFIGEESLTQKNLVIANKSELENAKITLRIKGSKIALDKLKTHEKSITATVNLKSSYYGVTINDPNDVPINITLPTIGTESFQIVEQSRQSIEIILEEIQTISAEIKVNTIGEPKSGFVSLTPRIDPSTVKVKGATSTINKLDSVKVNVDITGISKDLFATDEPKAYDANGNVLSGLELSIKEVQIEVPINEYKKVTIESLTQGIPEDGYTFTGISCDPEYIEIVGDSESIAKLEKIQLPVINVSGYNQTKEIVYDIRDLKLLPSNVSIKNGTPNQVKVIVKIAKEETKDFEIPIENVTVSGFNSSTQQYTIRQEPIILTLKGLSTIIESIKIEDIKCTIDLSSYGEGTHDVPVKFSLPSRVSLVEDKAPIVNITITSITQPLEESTSAEQTTTEETTDTFKSIEETSSTSVNQTESTIPNE